MKPHGPAPRWNWPCRACRSAGSAEGVGEVAAAGRGDAVPTEVIPAQDAAQVSASWPSGPIDLRLSP